MDNVISLTLEEPAVLLPRTFIDDILLIFPSGRELFVIFDPLIWLSAKVNVEFWTSIVFPLERTILLLLIVLFVNVCVPVNVVTVLSIEYVTVSFDIDVLIPVPPVNCRVSDPREIVSVPESEEILRSVDILDVEAEVIRPFSSILRTGIAVDDP